MSPGTSTIQSAGRRYTRYAANKPGARVTRFPLLISLPFHLLSLIGVVLGIVEAFSTPRQDRELGVLEYVAFVFLSAMTWMVMTRPRLVITCDEIVIVNFVGSKRVPIAHIVGAKPGWEGTNFILSNGEQVWSWVLQKSNYRRWHHQRTSSDSTAIHIVRRSAALNGYDPASVEIPDFVR